VRLLPQEKQAIEATPTQNIDAYNFYLQGQHFYHLHTTPHVLLAQRLFRKAVELDPVYARAYAGLAYCAWFLFANHHVGATVADILEASTKAMALDPDLAEAHVAHALALHHAGRVQEAASAYEQAIALNPNLFEAFYQYTESLISLGDWEKAAKTYVRASEIEPADFRCPLMLSQMYKNLGREAESRKAAKKGIERAERALAAHPDIPLPAALGACALARTGDRAGALEWASRALMIAPDDPLTQYNVACAYSLLGELDQAVDVLQHWSVRANAQTKSWLVGDTDFDVIRNHPRYRKLIE
jgi:adenylate cyclase